MYGINSSVIPRSWLTYNQRYEGKPTGFIFYTNLFFPGCIRFNYTSGACEVFINKAPLEDPFSNQKATYESLALGKADVNFLECLEWIKGIDSAFGNSPTWEIDVNGKPVAYIWVDAPDDGFFTISINAGVLEKPEEVVKNYYEDLAGVVIKDTTRWWDRTIVQLYRASNPNCFVYDFPKKLATLISESAIYRRF